MNSREELEQHIIIKVLRGDATEEEVTRLESWITDSEENRKEFLAIQELWLGIDTREVLTNRVQEEDWARLEARLKGKIVKMDNVVSKPSPIQWILKTAAVFLLGFGIAWFLYQGIPGGEAAIAYNEISTPLGSRTLVDLPDGSKVWLNAGSKLRYPQTFQSTKRSVFLEGEGYFEVSENQHHKFLVETSDITVKVYGTSFNVKSYPNEQTVETTLVEGKISLIKNSSIEKAKPDELVMQPNQRVVFYKASQTQEVISVDKSAAKQDSVKKEKVVLSKQVNTELFTSWKEGELIIESELMESLAVKLERRYNVKIHFEDNSLKNFRFTGKIQDETVEQVFAAIKLASGIDYRIEHRDVWIKKSKQE